MTRNLTLLVCLLLTATASAQDDDVQIKTISLRPGVHMLQGKGGNVGVFVGDDGAFMIDDQFAPLTPKLLAAIGKLTDKPVKFLVNTHWHGDHTGGNENMGKAGAVIVAHDNVRKRMSTEQFMTAFKRKVPPSPKVALPVITFADSVTFHWNGDTVKVTHVGPAHTDGDAVVKWETANVIHTGDVYSAGVYPFLDSSSGGSLAGMVKAGKTILSLCDEKTIIIPGHGPPSTKKDLAGTVSMLETVLGRLRKLRAEGKSEEEMLKAEPTKDYDATYGGGWLKPERWLKIVYPTVKAGR